MSYSFFPVKRKIYIAGSMSAHADNNFNRDQFNVVAEIIREIGHVALNPAILPDGLHESEYMSIGLSMLQVADTIMMLPGWEISEGATVEKLYAEKVGKEVVCINSMEDIYLVLN
ncbi:MAG: DUF4406 domain-containing protein [Emcibacteraceae bacterium]|nr:DUF4406 domain-containing protein [Emcibacteraceae bacterium]